MVNELLNHKEDKVFNLLMRAYQEIASYLWSPPDLEALCDHYGALAEMELINYMAAQYGDDFYDGSPRNRANFLPDSMRHDVSEQVKIPLEISVEEVMELLNSISLVYKDKLFYYNSPLQEVW